MEGLSRPLPVVRPETKTFWEGTKRHEFLLQRCQKCSEVNYPPRVACPRCLGTDIEWFKASGRGQVYTYTIIYQAADKSFEKDLPYVYAIIELEEGVRVVSNVVNVDPRKVSIG